MNGEITTPSPSEIGPIGSNPEKPLAADSNLGKTPEKPTDEIAKTNDAKTEQRIADTRAEIAGAAKTDNLNANQNLKTENQQRAYLYGDFQGAQLDQAGKIVLPAQVQTEVIDKVNKHTSNRRFSLPSFLSGDRTATEYNNKAANFSTRTKIITLADGRKIFAIYDYPLSFIHRFFDGMATHGAGDRMAKASKKEWKGRFESKSNVPVIAYEEPHVVLTPYIENVNAIDAFKYNRDLQNLGEFSWVKDLTLEDKTKLGESVIQELQKVHAQGKTWGETILPNMIVTKDRAIVIVDPETAYDEDVSLPEQRARDLRDAVYSIAGALHHSEGVKDYGPLVKRLLDKYSNQEVITSLKAVASKPLSIKQKLFTLVHEVLRLGISMAEMKKVSQAIAAY